MASCVRAYWRVLFSSSILGVRFHPHIGGSLPKTPRRRCVVSMLTYITSCFYHQLIRRGCSSIAYFVTDSCLHLKKGGLIRRYQFLFLTFAVSGIFHTFSDITQGIPWRESGAMEFFCVQTLGIMLEDAVQALYRARRVNRSEKSHTAANALGYVWVVAWLVWSTPRWTYPIMQRDTGGRILPLSPIGLLKA